MDPKQVYSINLFTFNFFHASIIHTDLVVVSTNECLCSLPVFYANAQINSMIGARQLGPRLFVCLFILLTNIIKVAKCTQLKSVILPQIIDAYEVQVCYFSNKNNRL